MRDEVAAPSGALLPPMASPRDGPDARGEPRSRPDIPWGHQRSTPPPHCAPRPPFTTMPPSPSFFPATVPGPAPLPPPCPATQSRTWLHTYGRGAGVGPAGDRRGRRAVMHGRRQRRSGERGARRARDDTGAVPQTQEPAWLAAPRDRFPSWEWTPCRYLGLHATTRSVDV